MRAKPVDLPPPKLVWKPNAKTTSGVTLYILANFSLISVLRTDGWPGWRTSTTWNRSRTWIFEKYLTLVNKCLPFVCGLEAYLSWTSLFWLLRFLPPEIIIRYWAIEIQGDIYGIIFGGHIWTITIIFWIIIWYGLNEH